MSLRLLAILLLTFGFSAQAQDDPDFTTIDFGAFVLEEQPDIFSEEFNFVYTGNYPLTPIVFNTQAGSYWQPVDMMAAVNEENRQKQRAIQLRPVRIKSLGFNTRAQYGSDSQTKVQNFAYRDMRNLQLINPCDRFGMGWRCNPYRFNGFNQGFR